MHLEFIPENIDTDSERNFQHGKAAQGENQMKSPFR